MQERYIAVSDLKKWFGNKARERNCYDFEQAIEHNLIKVYCLLTIHTKKEIRDIWKSKKSVIKGGK